MLGENSWCVEILKMLFVVVYISEVRGSEFALVAAPPNREIDFDFDFDSIVRAGEAKLCGCVRDMPPQRWGCKWEEVLLPGLFLLVFAIPHTGSKLF